MVGPGPVGTRSCNAPRVYSPFIRFSLHLAVQSCNIQIPLSESWPTTGPLALSNEVPLFGGASDRQSARSVTCAPEHGLPDLAHLSHTNPTATNRRHACGKAKRVFRVCCVGGASFLGVDNSKPLFALPTSPFPVDRPFKSYLSWPGPKCGVRQTCTDKPFIRRNVPSSQA